MSAQSENLDIKKNIFVVKSVFATYQGEAQITLQLVFSMENV